MHFKSGCYYFRLALMNWHVTPIMQKLDISKILNSALIIKHDKVTSCRCISLINRRAFQYFANIIMGFKVKNCSRSC